MLNSVEVFWKQHIKSVSLELLSPCSGEPKLLGGTTWFSPCLLLMQTSIRLKLDGSTSWNNTDRTSSLPELWGFRRSDWDDLWTSSRIKVVRKPQSHPKTKVQTEKINWSSVFRTSRHFETGVKLQEETGSCFFSADVQCSWWLPVCGAEWWPHWQPPPPCWTLTRRWTLLQSWNTPQEVEPQMTGKKHQLCLHIISLTWAHLWTPWWHHRLLVWPSATSCRRHLLGSSYCLAHCFGWGCRHYGDAASHLSHATHSPEDHQGGRRPSAPLPAKQNGDSEYHWSNWSQYL